MTETDIEKRLIEVLHGTDAVLNFTDQSEGLVIQGDVLDRLQSAIAYLKRARPAQAIYAARDELRGLRQRISELEYRGRSRECVGRPTALTRCYECDGPLNGPYCPACNADEDPGETERLRRRVDELEDELAVIFNGTGIGRSPTPARPDAVQILRERAEPHIEVAYGNRAEGHNLTFHLVLGACLEVVADALEKERTDGARYSRSDIQAIVGGINAHVRDGGGAS